MKKKAETKILTMKKGNEEEKMKNRIIGYCLYCKNPIYINEPFANVDNNLYHASENEEHDNCYLLIIKSLKEML